MVIAMLGLSLHIPYKEKSLTEAAPQGGAASVKLQWYE